MATTRQTRRLTETLDWASLALVAGAVIAYLITSSAILSLSLLVPATACRFVILHIQKGTDHLLLFIGTLAATLSMLIMALGQ